MQPADMVSIGEIMVESIFHLNEFPPHNKTIIVNRRRELELGGAAINVAWYLGCLGKSARLVAPISNRHVDKLSRELAGSGVDLSTVISTRGHTDHLMTLLSSRGHRSIYTLGDTPKNLSRIMVSRSKTSRMIVMNGGRHPDVRKAFETIVDKHSSKIIVFNPSYAVYEYSHGELSNILGKCDVSFLNQDEYRFVRKTTGKEVNKLPRVAFVTTLSTQGATMFFDKRKFHVKALSRQEGVFLGAGDACLAGFSSGLLDGISPHLSLERGLRLAQIVVEHAKIRTKISKSNLRWLTNLHSSSISS